MLPVLKTAVFVKMDMPLYCNPVCLVAAYILAGLKLLACMASNLAQQHCLLIFYM
jgi:hypothetical protein